MSTVWLIGSLEYFQVPVGRVPIRSKGLPSTYVRLLQPKYLPRIQGGNGVVSGSWLMDIKSPQSIFRFLAYGYQKSPRFFRFLCVLNFESPQSILRFLQHLDPRVHRECSGSFRFRVRYNSWNPNPKSFLILCQAQKHCLKAVQKSRSSGKIKSGNT